MLKHRLLHPEISEILARAGHHAKVLIADGNYPASTTLGPNARLVSLNLAPGLVTVSQVQCAPLKQCCSLLLTISERLLKLD